MGEIPGIPLLSSKGQTMEQTLPSLKCIFLLVLECQVQRYLKFVSQLFLIRGDMSQ